MKKAFLIALISVLAIIMTACGKVEDETLSKAETTAATAETTVTTTVSEETETTTSAGTSATTSKTSTSATTTTAKTSTTKKATTTNKSSNQSSSGGNVVNNGGNSNNNYNSNNNSNNQSYNNSSGGNSSNNQTTQARTTTQAPMTTTRKPQTTTQAVQTTQAQPQNHLTQSDMDNLKNELQEYSNSKAVYLQEHYSDCLYFNGTDWVSWESFEALIQNGINKSTPYNSGYDDVVTITYDGAETYSGIISFMKNDIDYAYQKRPDCHYVVYIENCPNGTSYGGGTFGPCWNIYLLY